MNNFIPRYFTNKAMALYALLLVAVALLFRHYPMPWFGWVWGMVSVLGFFYYSSGLTLLWSRYSPKYFLKRLFWTAFIIRVVYVVISYFFYQWQTGQPFEFATADAWIYHVCAKGVADAIRKFDFHLYNHLDAVMGSHVGFSDTGYPIYLAFVYALTDNSIIAARLFKALWGAWTVVLVYKLAQRHFGESTARIAAILCMLMPNLILYCGKHLKETEMVFLVVLFVERGDALMRNSKFVFSQTFLVVLIGLLLFSFRTVLGAVALLSFFLGLMFSVSRFTSINKIGRRIIIIVLALGFVGLMMQNRITEEIEQIQQTQLQQSQTYNYDYRSRVNSYARYASAAVFAPVIFTIPFPTLVGVPGQEDIILYNGANFVKNIMSFFTLIAMLLLFVPYNWRRNLLDGEWRFHVFPLAFLLGYLFVLVFSNFSQSERFHMPSLPLLLMFAAYGVANYRPKWKRWYWIWLAIIFVANIGWAYIKLRGRGMA
ncbi:MAG: glycosyltransferase family 39 protein [Paludibacteraceae bacterium]|nr:glycosyltransferase family 39 protein [Paludibacteraceae bacterium]